MRSSLKFFSFLFALTLVMSCGGGGGEDTGSGGGGDTGGGGNTANPPGKATPTAPANNKTCETGTSVSDTQSSVTFSWNTSADSESYDLKVTNLNTNGLTNKTGLSTTSTTMTLDKGVPYSWNVTSKNTKTTTTATSDTWKFYLAGTGISNYAPFPADLLTPKSESSVSSGSINFEWEGSDADSDDSLTYDLYLDTSNPPANKVKTNLSSNSTNVTLDAGTYYWKIVTKDSQGSNSDSGVSMFKAVD